MDIESTIITALSFSPVIHNLGSTKTVIGLSFAENTNETKIIIFYESYCYLLGFSVTLNINNKNIMDRKLVVVCYVFDSNINF